MLKALVHLESKDLIHRDIKPENILFQDLQLKSVALVDFGFMTRAKEYSHLFTRCGTPGYVAPEVLADKPYNTKIDVFSTGGRWNTLNYESNDVFRAPQSTNAYTPQFFWKTGVLNFNWEQFKTPNTGLLLKKCCNRFPRSSELGDKDNMYRNLFFHARDLRGAFNLQEVVPITFSFRAFEIQFDRDLQLFLKLFKALETKSAPETTNFISKRLDPVLGEEIEVYSELPGLEFPARNYKDRDKSFHNPHVTSDTIAKLPTQFDGQNLWIIKPSECDRGQGVEIFRSLDELARILGMFSKGYRLAEYTSMNYD